MVIHILFTKDLLTFPGRWSIILYEILTSSRCYKEFYSCSDQLNLFLLIACLICWLLCRFIKAPIVVQILSVAGYVLIFYSLYRTFSRNYDRRRAENNRFLSITDPITRNFRRMNAQARDRDHKYFRCPTCGQLLRVPKCKGRIHISCRNCGASFEKKT